MRAALVLVVITMGVATSALAQDAEQAAGAAAASARIEPAALRAAIRHYRSVEPPIGRVVAAALDNTGQDPGRARSLATRARLSGLIPVVRLGARRGQGRDATALTTTEDTGRTNLSTDDDLTLSAWLTFRLDRLVYARDEVGILREERAMEAARSELTTMVVHVYFERRRLQLERDLMGASGIAHATRIGEATALLNAFTGGAFERMMGALERGGARRSPEERGDRRKE